MPYSSTAIRARTSPSASWYSGRGSIAAAILSWACASVSRPWRCSARQHPAERFRGPPQLGRVEIRASGEQLHGGAVRVVGQHGKERL